MSVKRSRLVLDGTDQEAIVRTRTMEPEPKSYNGTRQFLEDTNKEPTMEPVFRGHRPRANNRTSF